MKKSLITVMAVAVLIVSALLVIANTASNASPSQGETKYVTANTVINHSVTLLFDTVDLSLDDIINVTLWGDINGTWEQLGNFTAGNKSVSWVLNGIWNTSTDGVKRWNVRYTNSSNSHFWFSNSNWTYIMDFVDISSYTLAPANNTFFSDSTPEINLTVVATDTPLECTLYLSNSTGTNTFTAVERNTNVANNTLTAFGNGQWSISQIGVYRGYFDCTKAGSGIRENSTVFTLNYDQTTPSVTVNAPADNSWSAASYVSFNITPTDVMTISNCTFWHDASGTWELNATSTTVTDGTLLNIGGANFADNITGLHWGYRCTDIANNIAATNLTVYVDTVALSGLSCVAPFNVTRATDRRPTLQWNLSVYDASFARYTIFLYNSSLTTPVFSYNITSVGTQSYEITDNLTSDMQWYWNVSATDQAGNTNTSLNCSGAGFMYYPDSTGWQLKRGYNYYSIVRENVSASIVCGETDTTPTSVSTWNTTDNSWITHVCGTSTNNNHMLYRYQPIVLNLASDTVWDSGRVWAQNSTSVPMNITNTTNTGWNLVGVNADTTFDAIDVAWENHRLLNFTAVNTSVNWMSYSNHSNYYISFRNTWKYNNGTQLLDGDAVWLHLTGKDTMFLNRSAWGVWGSSS